MTDVPRLDLTTDVVQIVDGHNYLIRRFQENVPGLILRNIIADIRGCTRPPIFVFDGPRGNERRRKLFPPYKVRPLKETVARENIYPTLDLFMSLMPMLPCVFVRLQDWEADDVMATLARNQAALGYHVRVVTTDRDLSQLASDPLIRVTAELPGIPPREVRLYKTFIGDSSDKIPGVKSFGPKSWARLNKVLVQTLLENNDNLSRYSADELGLTTAHHVWICHNQQVVRLYWDLVELQEVPRCEITPAIKVGQDSHQSVDNILMEFML